MWGIFVLLALMILGGLWGRWALHRGLQRFIEDSATQALGVDVEIESLHLGLWGGTLTFKDLTIANPAGFQHEHLLSLKQGAILLDVTSLLRDRIEISSVSLDGMTVLWEQQGANSNLQTLMDQLPARDSTRGPSRPLHIRSLEMKHARVEVQLPSLPGQDEGVTLELPPMHLSELGTQDALDLRGLVRKLVSALVTQIMEQGAEELPAAIVAPLKNSLHSGLKFLRGMKDLLLPPSTKKTP